MSNYRHTQTAWFLHVALGIPIVVTFFVLLRTGAAVAILLSLLFAVLLVLFRSLTIEVSPDEVRLWYGPGLIRKSFATRDIEEAEAVRNRWWYGWGIRLTPHGWLFNVQGLDAVELRMSNGRKYRLGTDEPERLEAAIRGVLRGTGIFVRDSG